MHRVKGKKEAEMRKIFGKTVENLRHRDFDEF